MKVYSQHWKARDSLKGFYEVHGPLMVKRRATEEASNQLFVETSSAPPLL